MLSLKNVKNGGVAIVFGKEFAEEARMLFPAISAKIFGFEKLTALPEKKESSLLEIKQKVEGCGLPKPSVQLSIEKLEPSKPDFSVYVKQYVDEESKQMLAYKRIYAEIYARTGLKVNEEKKKMIAARKEKPHGMRGPQIWASDVIRALGLNDLALEIAKQVVKEV
ncbi:hypothetical protein COJ96_05640 [Bacillus sp. AFS073361]|uniref:hypothetical protein n=1 Tax=Bacillus sp. AFS073361 TaxID=2033511 RepID=UPI000BF53C8B|nr:hypothetical protein [Bacillus sp. AFS073361]PFP30196.1 hypothetical protein COJ96_05640 [Bacillus sp. AFS073361]